MGHRRACRDHPWPSGASQTTPLYFPLRGIVENAARRELRLLSLHLAHAPKEGASGSIPDLSRGCRGLDPNCNRGRRELCQLAASGDRILPGTGRGYRNRAGALESRRLPAVRHRGGRSVRYQCQKGPKGRLRSHLLSPNCTTAFLPGGPENRRDRPVRRILDSLPGHMQRHREEDRFVLAEEEEACLHRTIGVELCGLLQAHGKVVKQHLSARVFEHLRSTRSRRACSSSCSSS